ncbi:MAG TPA: adenylate/guanylate cyclase domain-containing protein [Spirochaetota bacterium]
MKQKDLRTAGTLLVVVLSLMAAVALGETPIFRYVENKIDDMFFQLRDATGLRPHGNPAPVIVGIDRQTLEAYPDPVIFWDREFTDTIDAVALAKPTAIGFDILHLTTADMKHHDVGKMKVGDKLLSTPMMVLPYAVDGDNLAIPVYVARRYSELFGFSGSLDARRKLKLLSIAERIHGVPFGFANLTDDDDGVVRNAQLYETAHGAHRDSFPLKIFLRHCASTAVSIEWDDRYLRVNGHTVPSAMTINYSGPPGAVHMVPLSVVAAHKHDRKFLTAQFAGKIVLFGGYDPSLGDVHNTPYISSTAGNTRGMYGVEIIANMLDTLVRGRMIGRTPYPVSVALCILFAVCGVALSRLRTGHALSGFAVAQGLFFIAVFLLFARGYIFVPMLPSAALSSGFFFGYLYSHYLLGRDRHLLQTVLNSYLDPRIVDMVVRDQGAEILKGQRRAITVMFADIRNFTSFSESRKRPEDVVALLNIYLPAMSSVIYEHEGCVDKFIGDGIMAFWNAPNEVPDHAEKAVRCALEMLRKLTDVNRAARGRKLISKDLEIGIGIHTGYAVVGNIGSAIKHDYTAIGDTVNVSARLEGKTKDLGFPIIISDATESRIRKIAVETVSSGTVMVKGKKKGVKVFGIDFPE